MSEERVKNVIGLAEAVLQKELLRSKRRINRLHLALLREGIPHSINYGVDDATNSLTLGWAYGEPLIYAPGYEIFQEKYRLKIKGERIRNLTFKDAVQYARQFWDEHEAK